MDPKLKDFIYKQVSTTCDDADPEILTNYVLALLGESKSAADIKANLKEKLQEFFENETDGFIDRLYNYLDSGKAVNKDEGQEQPATTQSSSRRDAEDEDDEEDGDSSFKHRRHRHDDDDNKDSSKHDIHPSRQKRRLSHQDDTEGQNKSRRNYRPHRDDPESNDLASSSSNYDRRTGGYQNRYGGNNGRPAWKNSRPMCRDYNEKGYCVRGDLCPYDHGKDTIVYEDKTPLSNPVMPMMPPPNVPFNMPNVLDKDAFSPEKMAAMQAAFPGMMPSPEDFMKMMMQQQPQQQFGQQQYGRGAGGPMRRGRGAGAGPGIGGRGRGRGGYGQQMNSDRYNSNRQQSQRLSTTLVIDNIPPEKCQMVPINDYFKKFGNITNIQLHPRKALVQFGTRAEAEAAHASPDVIFDNRFVKVYWHKESTGDFGQGTGTGGPKNNNAIDDGKWKNQQRRDVDQGGDNSDASAPAAPAPVTNEPDPTLVAAKAAELQKLRDAKLKKRQEQMKLVLDLQKQKEQLLQHQIDEQKKLLAKLTDKSLTQTQKEDLLQSLRKISSDIDSSKANSAAPSTTTNPESSDYLKDKLAKLEAEAVSMGITPDSVKRPSYHDVQTGGYYGGGRPPRGGPPMMMKRSLDNRPTKVMVKDIPQDASEEGLKTHFEQFGRVISFEKAENGIVTHYSQRFEAEKAMAMGSKFGSGKLSLSWYANTQSV